MSNIFLHINVSLDGFIEDLDHGIDWHFVDDEFEQHINEVLRSISGMVFGRTAHQVLARYWPNAGQQVDITDRHREAVALMNSLPKYVVASADYHTTWENSIVLSDDLEREISRLRRQSDRDLAVFAGARVARAFIDRGLLDELRLVVNPILLGHGTPLFTTRPTSLELELHGTRTFRSGAVLLTYRPIGERADAVSAGEYTDRANAASSDRGPR